MKIKGLNVKLLRRIQKHILEEPRRFSMGEWLATDLDTKKKTVPPCGTIACIAGWAAVLSKTPTNWWDVSRPAEKVLGLENHGASMLFWVDAWPDGMGQKYENLKTPIAKARLACKRIDLLIEEGR